MAEHERDVALMVAALWPTYGRDFLDLADSWPGRPSTVKRLIQHLAEPGEQT